VRNEILVLDIPSPAFTPQKESHLTLDKRWRALRFLFLEESKKGNGNAIDQLLPYAINALEEENQPSSIQYIHEHFRESISLNKLADLEHYHTAYYHRWFRKQTGMSTTKYIQTLRLKEAKRLLENTDLPIYRVAIEVGYNHQSSLTRLFLQHEKITPNVYRKQVRSG
jgi:AraC-like DNA-binding protein